MGGTSTPPAAQAPAVSAPAGNGNGKPGTSSELTEEQRQANTAVSRNHAAAFGDLAVLAMQHGSYRNLAIGDLDWLIGPAIMTGNYMMAHATRKDGVVAPLAAVTWARVSEEVDRRIMENLSRPFRLSPPEYVSGEIYWLAHTFGPPQAVEAIIRTLVQEGGKSDSGKEIKPGKLAGKKLKQRVRDDSGRAVVVMVG